MATTLAFGMVVLLGVLAAPAAAQPPVLRIPSAIEGSPVFVALAPDAIRAIDDPTFVQGRPPRSRWRTTSRCWECAWLARPARIRSAI